MADSTRACLTTCLSQSGRPAPATRQHALPMVAAAARQPIGVATAPRSVPDQRHILTRLNPVNPSSNDQQPIRSRPSRTTIYTAAGTVLAASAAVTGLILLPADASKPLPTAADTGRHSMAGDLTRASYQSMAAPTARELHNLQARAQAAERAAMIARRRAAERAAAERRAAAAWRQAAQRRAAHRQAAQGTSAHGTSATAPAAPSGSPQQIA